MNAFYKRFQTLSDKNLFERLERRDVFQREAVEAAAQILAERGYDLQDCFLEGRDEPHDTVKHGDEIGTAHRPEDVDWFAFDSQSTKIPLIRIGLFLLLSAPIVYFFNVGFDEIYLVRKLSVFSDLILNTGSIKYLFHLLVLGVVILTYEPARIDFFKTDFSKLIVAIKVTLFSILVITLVEFLLSGKAAIFLIPEENSYRTFISVLIQISLLAFTEELIFRRLLLKQIFIRIRNTWKNRMILYIGVSIIFAAFHIPVNLAGHGYIKYDHLFFTFTFSYLCSVLYLRHSNFALAVGLHFFVDIPFVFLGEGGFIHVFFSIALIGLYCHRRVEKSWLFKTSWSEGILKRMVYSGITFLIVLGGTLFFFIQKTDLNFDNLAYQYYHLGASEEAEINAIKSLEKNSQNTKALNLMGNIKYDREEYSEAVNYFNKGLEIEPNNYLLLKNRGFAHERLENNEDCISDLTLAIENGMDEYSTFVHRGACFLRANEPLKAKEDLLKALSLTQNGSAAHYYMGRVYLNLGELDSSLHFFHNAIEIDSLFVKAIEGVAIVFSRLEQYDSSLSMINKAIELESDNPIRFYVRGIGRYHKGEYQDALADFENSLQLMRESSLLYAYLGYTHMHLENPEVACSYYAKAIELNEDEEVGELRVYCNVFDLVKNPIPNKGQDFSPLNNSD